MAIRRKPKDSGVDLGDTVIAKILQHSVDVPSDVKLDKVTDKEVETN